MGRVHLSGFIDIPESHRETVGPHLRRHIDLTRAEPGCVRFEVVALPDIPGRYSVSETFADRAAFDAHQDRVRTSDWGTFTAGFHRDYEIREDD